MGHAKLFVAALAATAFLAFASTAPATTLTSNEGETPTVHSVSEGGFSFWYGLLGISAQCYSTIHVSAVKHGSGVTAGGNAKLAFSGCQNGYEVTVLASGSMEIHSNNVLTSTGAEVTIKTPLGFNCIYKTNATDIGTITESSTTGGKATLDIGAKAVPRTGHSAFCGASGEWRGSYIVNSPTTLNVD